MKTARHSQATTIARDYAWSPAPAAVEVERRASRKHAAKLRVAAVLVTTVLWLGAMSFVNRSVFEHNAHDQHTRQAESWLKGSIELSEKPDYLELVDYNGHIYNSFPPTPSLLEVPNVLLFGRETPNSFTLFLLTTLAVLAQLEVLLMFRVRPARALIGALAFTFCTNVLNSLTFNGVWGFGQVEGFCFAIFAIYFATVRSHTKLGAAFAGLMLAFAVGCRPFYLFGMPFIAILLAKRNRTSFLKAAIEISKGAFPYLGLMAVYNLVRFGNPLEFGHKYLPWSLSLEHGVFSFFYLGRNAYHTFINLPTLDKPGIPLEFHGRGTAFWINNFVFVLGVAGLAWTSLHRSIKIAAAFALSTVWLGLLLHESNGWCQFGYRYLIDLLPFAFFGYAAALSKIQSLNYSARWRIDSLHAVILTLSLMINVYGLWWCVLPPR